MGADGGGVRQLLRQMATNTPPTKQTKRLTPWVRYDKGDIETTDWDDIRHSVPEFVVSSKW